MIPIRLASSGAPCWGMDRYVYLYDKEAHATGTMHLHPFKAVSGWGSGIVEVVFYNSICNRTHDLHSFTLRP